MGEREVDEIIAQWRDSARAAGEPGGDWPADTARPWRPPRGWLLGLAGLLGAVAVAAVLLAGRDSPAPAPPDAAPSPAVSPTAAPAPLVDDWFAVMVAVDRARRVAYSSADGTGLAAVFLPTGEALQRELELLGRMRTEGVTAPGWTTRVLGVSPMQVDGESARLRVLDERAAYDLVGADGAITEVAAAPASTWLVTLRRAAGSWLVERVEPES